MCGIVGFTGAAQAAPILLDGLSKLEYRGYDSAGIAVQNAAGKIEVVKAKGRLKVLSEMTDGGNAVHGSCGIGHTRWATHGEPSVVNAHPHYSRDQKIAVVHNGIIENYQEIKDRLLNKGFTFVSQTDTEVVAQLLDYYYTAPMRWACFLPMSPVSSMPCARIARSSLANVRTVPSSPPMCLRCSSTPVRSTTLTISRSHA